MTKKKNKGAITVKMVALSDLGFGITQSSYQNKEELAALDIGRISREHKERYCIRSASGEWDAEVSGQLRFTATSRLDLPVIGDWVAFIPYDEGKALIHTVFPRTSILQRRATGKLSESQPIAANIDYALIVQSLNRDFNINRLERYLTLCYASSINPLVLFNKIDMIGAETLIEQLVTIQQRVPEVPIFPVSAVTGQGLEAVLAQISAGKTYCLLGSSGVGKSSLINVLLGKERMKTGDISAGADRGKHVTTHRELVVLDTGGIIIDNPGIREVGMVNVGQGVEQTFDAITELSDNCRFRDCTHQREKGCAVLAALQTGALDEAVYANYQNLQREQQHFEEHDAAKRRKEKVFSKMVKRYYKDRNNWK